MASEISAMHATRDLVMEEAIRVQRVLRGYNSRVTINTGSRN